MRIGIKSYLTSVFDRILANQISDGGADNLATADAAGENQGTLHTYLLNKYQVSVDPDGMVIYPDGGLRWMLERMGHSPQRMTQGEAGPEELLGDWDTVHIFPDPVSRDYVEEVVGDRIDMGHFSSSRGHILVFMRKGEVQQAVFTVPNNLVEGRYSDKVVLRTREQPGSAVLDVIDER